MSDLLLNLEKVSVKIGDKQILDKISLSISKGKITTIIGPNGSGKTTIVRCILKLIEINQGKIWFKPNLKLGYMPQKINLNPNLPLTVLGFLKLNINHKIIDSTLNDVINEVNISSIISHPLQKLSGGEMQKTLLARALLTNPELLILDEPVQGVDINGQVEFYNLIEKLRVERNIGILVISHDLHMVMKGTDYVICLNQHICCEGVTNFVNQHKDFKKLFGNEALKAFSVYEHHHDHTHS
jgi:zinc transport system ATP-binding protein